MNSGGKNSAATGAAPSPLSGLEANAGIEAFLEGYCAATTARNYAVLLEGPWGSGKTFFLKGFLTRHNIAHVYVSLYGVSSTTEVEHQIFAQLHPVLASKAMKIVGIVAKAVVKGTLKIDLNNDGTADGTAGFSMPEAKLEEFAKSAAGRVLVFDDLERANMKTAEILGFINAFVEHEDMKAIVVANEDEVERNDENFRRIKEKLIGQTLRVKASIPAIYPELLPLIEDPWSRQFLQKHAVEVLEVFDKSEAHNIRVLKQAMWDFERLAKTFRSPDRGHESALIKILKAFVALSIEIRMGRLKADDINESKVTRLARYIGKNKDRPATAFEIAEARYPGIDLRQSFIDSSIVTALVVQGHVDPGVVQASLDRGPPFIPPAQEVSWRRAWKGWQSSDAEFEAAMTDFERDLAELRFSEPGEVLHVFGLLLQAADIGRGGETRPKAVKKARAYVDALEAAGRIDIPVGRPEVPRSSGFGGFGFIANDTKEFRSLEAYYSRVRERVWKKNLPRIAADLLASAREKPDVFAESISVNAGGSADYWDVPLLHHIAQADFVALLLAVNPEDQRTIMLAIQYRLSQQNGGEMATVLAKELPWLRRVIKDLRAAAAGLGDMSRYRIRKDVDRYLAPLLPRRKAEKDAGAGS